MSYKSALVEMRNRYGAHARAKATGCSRAGIKRKRECRVGYYHLGERRVLWTGHGETWEAALADDAQRLQRKVRALAEKVRP